MKKEFTDEQIDRLMRSVLADAAPDSDLIDEVAESPAVWWGVQRDLARGRDAEIAPWPPSFNWVRLLGISTAAILAAVIGMSWIVMRPAANITRTAAVSMDETSTAKTALTATLPETTVTTKPNVATTVSTITPKRSFATVPKANSRVVTPAAGKSGNRLPVRSGFEIKTDFIALAYARTPDSGQIVRVKVPSSMKVSLGVASNVANPSDMVDAEILVGDDGLTRAIRFIR